MEFNETLSVYSLILYETIAKVSDEKDLFSSKDTAHHVSTVLLYWGLFLVEGDPFNENVGRSFCSQHFAWHLNFSNFGGS